MAAVAASYGATSSVEASRAGPCRLGRRAPLVGPVLVDHAVLHHQRHVPERPNVARGVAGDGDEIGFQPGCDAADLIGHVQDRRVDRCGRAERGDRCHAPGYQELELACVVAVGEYAGVTAVADGDARIERGT